MNEYDLDDTVDHSGDTRCLQPYNILIIYAIEELEGAALTAALIGNGAQKTEARRYEEKINATRWSIWSDRRKKDITILTKCLNGQGNALAGIDLSYLLFDHRPSLICFCGIGGSLNTTAAEPGDVVVSKAIRWVGLNKISPNQTPMDMRRNYIFDEGMHPDVIKTMERFYSDQNDTGFPNLKTQIDLGNGTAKQQAIRHWKINALNDEDLRDDIINFDEQRFFGATRPFVKFGKAFSSDYVLNWKEFRDQVVAEDNQLIVGEMEGGGLLHAAKSARVKFAEENLAQFISVRGVSDICNKKMDDCWREIAADHAASFLVAYLKNAYQPTG